MTTEPEAIPADVLEPCPFCGARLERGMHNRRNRDGSFAYMCVHPDVEPRCVASSVVVWAGERESEDAWNRRASRAPVDGAEAKPVAEGERVICIDYGTVQSIDEDGNAEVLWDVSGCIGDIDLDRLRPVSVPTHPAPSSPDAEMPIASNGGATLPELLAAVEGIWPGSFWHLAKGRISFDEPLFGFQVLFGTGEVLAEGEGNSAVSAISAAIAKAEGRSAILDRLREGAPRRTLAREFGVNPATIRYHEKTRPLTSETEQMDAWELAEDMLDAIAAERDNCLRNQSEAAARLDEASARSDRQAMGEASSEISRHMQAVQALNMALARCQSVVDEAVAELEDS